MKIISLFAGDLLEPPPGTQGGLGATAFDKLWYAALLPYVTIIRFYLRIQFRIRASQCLKAPNSLVSVMFYN